MNRHKPLSVLIVLFLLVSVGGASQVQILKPATQTDAAGSTTSDDLAHDFNHSVNTNTSSSTDPSNNNDPNPSITWESWDTTGKWTYDSLTLIVSINTAGTVDDDAWSLHYDNTTDTACDSTDTTLKASGATAVSPITNYTAALPVDQNLDNLQVCISTTRSTGGDGYTVETWDVRTEGTNTPPTIRSNITYNGTDYPTLIQQDDLLRSDDLTIRANITDDSSSSVKHVNITLRNASGQEVVTNESMKALDSITINGDSGNTYEFNHTLAADAEIGTWEFTIWTNDTLGSLSKSTGTFDVYVPAFLNISFFNTTKWKADLYDTLNITANVTCSGKGTDAADAECGTVSGELHSADFDLEPDSPIPRESGTPFFIPAGELFNTSRAWWTAGNAPDAHIASMTSKTIASQGLIPGETSRTNITVNVSNNGWGTWDINVTLWRVSGHPQDWPGSTIISHGDTIHSMALGDIDGDNDTDIAFGDDVSQPGVFWLENTNGDGTAWSSHTVGVYSSAGQVESVSIADVDGDGSLDIVSGATDDGFDVQMANITFWNNTNGDGSSWDNIEIGQSQSLPAAIAIGDFDSDSDIDVVSSQEFPYTIKFWNHTNASANGWEEVPIKSAQDNVKDIATGDLDQDGDLDLVPVDGNRLYLWNNTNNSANGWDNLTIGSSGGNAVAVGDVDVDGDLDIVTTGSNVLFWNNTNNSANGWESVQIGSNGGNSVSLGDIDFDGDLDVVSSSGDFVYIWNNTEGDGSSWSRITVGSDSNPLQTTAVGNVDDHPDLDILSAGNPNRILLWDTSNISVALLNASTLSFTDVSGQSKTASFQWTPENKDYRLLATLGEGGEFSSVFETQHHSSVVNNVLVQTIDVPESPSWGNPASCPADPLTDGDTCSLTWTVNATEKGSFNIDANFSSGASWMEENDSGNRQVNVDLGFLNVSLLSPTVVGDPDSPFTIGQNGTFWLNASIICAGEAGDVCGSADGLARYTPTGEPNTSINTTAGATPFFVEESQGATAQTFTDVAPDWWANGSSPDLHVESIDSSLTADTPSTTNVTVNVSNFGQGTWKVNVSLWNVTAASFTGNLPANLTNPDSIRSLALGDITNDGRLDIFAGSLNGPSVVWEQQSDGTFTFVANLTHSHSHYADSIGDVNADGLLDVVSAQYTSDNVTIWRQQTDGSFTMAANLTHTNSVYEVGLGDTNGDGRLDIASAYIYNVTVWEQQSDGSFIQVANLSHSSFVYTVTMGDVDSDGRLDVVTAGQNGHTTVWRNTGSGFVSYANLTGSGFIWEVALGDMNNDGTLDVVAGGGGNEAVVWANRGGGDFDPVANLTDSSSIQAIALGDVNVDDRLDVVTAGNSQQAVVWEQQSDGTFDPVDNFTDPNNLFAAAVGDVNQDGVPDVLAAGDSANVTVWENTGPSSSFLGSTSLSFDDVNGSAKTAEITWTPTFFDYDLMAVADPFRNYTSVLRTQHQSGAAGNRLIQSANLLSSNPLSCPSLDFGQSCTLNWSINATGSTGENFFLDVNFSSTSYAGIEENDTENSEVCIGSCPAGDETAPLWRKQVQNVSSIAGGAPIELGAQGNDSTNLSHAILSTNETGTFANTSAHGSPVQLYTQNVWTWSNFTWKNESVRGTVGWRIWYNDTNGNYNVTDKKTFEVTAATFEQEVTQAVAISDSSPRTFSGSSLLSQTFDLSSVLPRGFSGFRIILPLVNYGEGILREVANLRLAPITIDFADAPLREVSNLRLLSQNVVAGDSVLTASDIGRGVSPVFTVVSTITRSFAGERINQDTLNFADAIERTVDAGRITITGYGFGDAESRLTVSGRAVTLTLSTSEQLLSGFAGTRALSQAYGYGSTISRQIVSFREAVETYSISDSSLSEGTLLRTFGTAYTYSSTLTPLFAGTRITTQGVNYASSFFRDFQGGRSVSDTFNTGSTITRTLSNFRSLTQTYSYSDSESTTSLVTRTLVETYSTAFTPTRIFAGVRTFTVTADYASSILSEVTLLKTLTQTFSVSDTSSRSFSGSRLLTTAADLTASTTFDFVGFRSIAETFVVTTQEFGTPTVFRSFISTFSFASTEIESSTLFRTFTEGFGLVSDSTRVFAGNRLLTETATLSLLQDRDISGERLLADGVLLTTDLSTTETSLRLLADIYSVSSTSSRSFAGNRMIAPGFVFGSSQTTFSSLDRLFTGAYGFVSGEGRETLQGREVTSPIGFMVQTDRTGGFTRLNPEGFVFSSQRSRTGSFLRNVLEPLSYTEQREPTVRFLRGVTDSFTTTTSLSEVSHSFRLLAQSLSVVGNLGRDVSLERTLDASLTFATAEESITSTGRLITQTYSYTSSRTFDVSLLKTLEETFQFTDAVSRSTSIFRIIQETFDFSVIFELFIPGGGGGETGGDTGDTDDGGGGGGGAAGGFFPSSEPSVSISTRSLVVKVAPGGESDVALRIVNNGTARGTYTLEVKNLSRFFAPSTTSYEIEPGEFTDVPFHIEVPEDQQPGVYRGAITTTVDGYVSSVPAVLVVSSRAPEQIALNLRMEDASFEGRGRFAAEVFNTGTRQSVSAEVRYEVVDANGSVIRVREDTVSVETGLLLTRDIGEGLSPGNYTLRVTANYRNQTTTTSTEFRVLPPTKRPFTIPGLDDRIFGVKIADILGGLFAVLGVIIFFVVLFGWADRREERKEQPWQGYRESRPRPGRPQESRERTVVHTEQELDESGRVRKIIKDVVRSGDSDSYNVCTECGYMFDSEKELERHKKREHGP